VRRVDLDDSWKSGPGGVIPLASLCQRIMPLCRAAERSRRLAKTLSLSLSLSLPFYIYIYIYKTLEPSVQPSLYILHFLSTSFFIRLRFHGPDRARPIPLKSATMALLEARSLCAPCKLKCFALRIEVRSALIVRWSCVGFLARF
jgi:hypothetical protein